MNKTEKLRKRLLGIGMFPCAECSYDCEPPKSQALCPKDADQILEACRVVIPWDYKEKVK